MLNFCHNFYLKIKIFLQELDIKLKRKTKKLNKNLQQTLFIFSVEKLYLQF